MKTLMLSLSILLLSVGMKGEVPPANVIFEQYLAQAQHFAATYPREKAYLHFDNTSYYVGDTIWFKAYVTLGEKKMMSPVSRPLYVELVDQAGHVTDKQIIKLAEGEGSGQFALSKSMMSGYYEVRAYTRWMLGFSEPQYFSRTFPIYRFANSDQLERSISTYELSPSMVKRPPVPKEKLSLRFFPEGGQLVEGILSRVAFKAESNKEEVTELSGTIYAEDGKEIVAFQSLHDGMGHFEYTPTSGPAVAKVSYQGKQYEFKLPQALPAGYVMKVENGSGVLSVKVSCNAATPQDTLAVFISSQGVPVVHQLVSCKTDAPQKFTLRARNLPSGVLQVSLVNRAGTTICERFAFSFSKAPLNVSVNGIQKVYNPYAPIRCELQVTNAVGEPVNGRLSVSIRDALHSDYQANDHNLFTDLLLTSDLKGYIHQPGYYFSETTSRKLEELDVLMLVHGWRKYDMSLLFGVTPFTPLQSPEAQLFLNGEIQSTLLKKPLKDIALNVMVKRDSTLITGQTITDEKGRFSIPMEDFEGAAEAVFQTRKAGKERNKDTSIRIDRHFSPVLRAYDFSEFHPQWKDTHEWRQTASRFDSLYIDSLRRVDPFQLLDEVEIVSKRKKSYNMNTKINEQSIDAYYDIRQELDQMRDQGKVIITLPQLMEKLSPLFYWNRSDDACTYRQKPICYIMEDRILSEIEVNMMLTEVDGLGSIIISEGVKGISDEIIQNSKLSNSNGVEVSQLDKYAVFYLIPLPRKNVLNESKRAALGTRQTVIQGYTRPLEGYAPAYKDKELYRDYVDKRRTLYWNPDVKTDAQGKAVIECYNNQYATPLIISAETIHQGVPGTLQYSTMELGTD